jgi:hypothetical protein
VRIALLLVRTNAFPDQKVHPLKLNAALDGFWKGDVLAQIKAEPNIAEFDP